MRTHSGSLLLLSSLCLGSLALPAAAGEADLQEGAAGRCEAAFGPGFVATPGGGCGWAGGHVRVGVGFPARRAATGEGGAMRVNSAGGPAPAAMSGHLRLNEDAADRVIRR